MNNLTELLERARAVCQRAYAPYSKFHVGTCLRTPANNLYVGCNVENASYGLTACAETGAISAMVAAGEYRISEILVTSSGAVLCAPCGACRQRLWEFGTKETLVHLCSASGQQQTFTLGELLPFSFDANTMGLS